MSGQRNQLIESLAAQLSPAPGQKWLRTSALLWLCFCVIFSTAVMLVVAPFRPDFHRQLLDHPQFLLEVSLGLGTVGTMFLAAWYSGIPMPTYRFRRILAIPLLLLVAWLTIQGFGLIHPALPVSMSGKREICWLETLLYGMPGMALGFWWINRMWPLNRQYSGALIGFSAGLIPAVLMQMACMYDSAHGLSHHTLPGLALGLIGALAGSLLIRRK